MNPTQKHRAGARRTAHRLKLQAPREHSPGPIPAPCHIDVVSLRRLVDENRDAIIVVDAEGTLRFANPATEKLLGRPVEALLDRPFGQPLVNGELAEIDIRRPDGSTRVAEMRTVRTLWTGAPGFVVTLRDITERRQLEGQLRRSQKMEALGRLAGGISHDFNNMLTSILCECSLLAEQLGVADPRRVALDQIRATAERAVDLTRQLLTFSRRRGVRHEAVDVAAVLHNFERMLRRLIGEQIALQVHVRLESAHVRLERSSLEQVVLNLALNARDAMPAGGRLDIVVEPPSIDDLAPGGDPASFVSIAVSDTGTGMAAEVQARLFEPFFTTKADGQGTGLGLSVVYGIVRQAHGRILVRSEPGCGSTFRVLLPKAEPATDESRSEEGAVPADKPATSPTLTPSATVPSAAPGAAATILLAEDEEAVREVVVDILEQAGHRVLAVADGCEAAAAFEKSHRDVQLLITDVSMPRMTGPMLAERLFEQRPDLPVLFLSGYAKDEAIFAHIERENVAFLDKPFTGPRLLEAVRRLIGG